jgi:uncharacterized membrane protein YkvA (DUF1232 family)
MENIPTEPVKKEPGAITNTPSGRGFPRWMVCIMAVVGVAYILNPGAGVFELLPDNLPIIGNLDEGAAVMAVWYGLMEFKQARKLRRG